MTQLLRLRWTISNGLAQDDFSAPPPNVDGFSFVISSSCSRSSLCSGDGRAFSFVLSGLNLVFLRVSLGLHSFLNW